jgi:hypothetical protein
MINLLVSSATIVLEDVVFLCTGSEDELLGDRLGTRFSVSC